MKSLAARSRALFSYAKRWLVRAVFVVGAFVLAMGAIALGSWAFASTATKDNSILHVTLNGTLREAPLGPVSALAAQAKPDDLLGLLHKLRAAKQDPKIVGLFLEVKAPQVGPAQLAEVSRAIASFKQSGKPSWSFLETAGEGQRGDTAYALAAMANVVMLAPPGEVALFGMRADVPFVKDFIAKLHVDAHVEQRYEYKSFADTFATSGFTAPHRESMQSLLDDLQSSYLSVVAAHRRVQPSQVRDWVLASPTPAVQAKASGVVDLLGYRGDMLALLDEAAKRPEPLLELEAYTPKKRPAHKERIALVTGLGEITRGEGNTTALGERDGMGSDPFVEALRQAREDHVQGILLRLNSPGGSYLASDLIRNELMLARNANIPVVVSMGDVAASGGYHIASAADHIVAEASTITGSIGVVGVSFAVRRALSDFLGVQFGSLASLPHAGVSGFLDPPDALDKQAFSRSMDRIYQDFVAKVASGRHKPVADVHDVAKGRVWTGQQALAHGLVDELGGYGEALAYLGRRLKVAGDKEWVLVPYPEPTSAWTLLREAIGGQAAIGQWLTRNESSLRPALSYAMGALSRVRQAAQAYPQAILPAQP